MRKRRLALIGRVRNLTSRRPTGASRLRAEGSLEVTTFHSQPLRGAVARRLHPTTWCALALATASVCLGTPTDAFANEDHFCVNTFYTVGDQCTDYQAGDWDRVRIRYAGNQNDGVSGTVWMANTCTGAAVRGGTKYVGRTWSSPTLNPFGHNYGDTFTDCYLLFNSNPMPNGHTFTGWGSDNQTDG
jgi:hypothetical protein